MLLSVRSYQHPCCGGDLLQRSCALRRCGRCASDVSSTGIGKGTGDAPLCQPDRVSRGQYVLRGVNVRVFSADSCRLARILYLHAEQFITDVVKNYQRKTLSDRFGSCRLGSPG